MGISDRIRTVCKTKRIKNIELVNAGCGSPQTISFVLNGKQHPSSAFLERFLRLLPDIDARWLITGQSNPIVEDPSQPYGLCKECIKKEGIIDHLKKECSAKDRRIEELLVKGHRNPGEGDCQGSSGKKAC